METADSVYNLNRKIFVGNVSYRVGCSKLSKFFKKFGDIEHCYIVKDHLKNWSRGLAFVTFKTEESKNRALGATEEELYFDGRQMRVSPAELSNKTSFWQDGNRKKLDLEEEEDACTQMQMDVHETCEYTESPRSLTEINRLFDELMIKIFNYLNLKEKIGIERVCWRWKHLVQRTWSAQKTLHFQNMFKRFGGLTDKSLNSVLSRCGQYIIRLDLSASPRMLTDFAMDIIDQEVGGVDETKVSCILCHQDVQLILAYSWARLAILAAGKHCPDLSELDLSNVKITNISLKNLVACCKSLKWVRLKSCLYIGDKGLQELFAGNQHLEYIDLSDLTQITGKLQDHAIHQLCSKSGESLEQLYLSHCRQLTGSSISHFCQYLSRLKVLHICGTILGTSPESYRDLEKLHNLEELNVSLNLHIDDRVLIGISQHCKNLRILDISGCHQGVTDSGVIALARLPQLNSLTLSYLNKVSEQTVVLLSHTLRLEKFVARATQFVTDQAVILLVNNCPQLYHLDLSGCFQITNAIFEAFREGSSVDNGNILVELYLGGTSVDWMSDDITWMSAFSNLKVSLHNLAIDQLRPDRDIILPRDEDYDSDEEEGQGEPRIQLQDVHPGGVEQFDDWEEDYDEDFLDNDDPLAAERWEMS